MPTARELALDILIKVDLGRGYANLLLPAALARAKLPPRDRALVTELVSGTVRRRGTLDWLIALHSNRPLSAIEAEALSLLRLAAYQIVYLDIPDRAAVHEAVESAKQRLRPGVPGLVNAVLRRLSEGKDNIPWPDRDKDLPEFLSVYYSHPRWMVELWLEELGPDETELLLDADNARPAVCVRTNTLKTTPDRLGEQLKEQGIETSAGVYGPEALTLEHGHWPADLLEQGLFYVQDESSMIVARMLGARPGETVIDVAAAPGGKTTHLAQLMENEGRIIALDSQQRRLKLIEDNCRRLGVTIVDRVLADATETLVLPPADRILLDAPCSGLGTLRRRPDARWQKQLEQIAELAALQLQVLRRAAGYLKPGGTLVYSVCTITKAETTDVLDQALANTDLELDDLTPDLPESLRADCRRWIQLLPHRHGTDGMFIARLKSPGTSFTS